MMPWNKKSTSATTNNDGTSGRGTTTGGGGATMTTPQTAPNSPFFQPSTPHVVVVQQTPKGSRKSMTISQEVEEHKSGIIGCTANLMNAIVGSGIVGIPYAIKQAGFVSGVLLVLLCAIITEKSLRLLIATAKHVHVPTYETTAEVAYGVWGFRFIVINMFIMSYGAMLSYLMVVKDSYSVMVGIDPDDLPQKRAVLLIVSILIMVPLSSQRDMADLAVTSRFNVVIDTLLVGLIALNSPIASNLKANNWTLANDIIKPDTIFVGLGVLSFAFVCQHSAFLVAGSLSRPTVKRWSIVTGISLTLCAALALTCGITGYLGHLDKTQGNILNTLDPSSMSANVARGMLGTTMLFVYPLESFVARHVCVVLLFTGRRAHEGEDSTILNRRDRRFALTAALYVLAVLPAALFENMGNVLAVTGAIGGSCLSYIGPGLVYIGIHGGRFMELLEHSWLSSMIPNSNKSSSSKSKQEQIAGDTAADKRMAVTLAVETTPLVKTQTEAADLVETEQSYDDDEEQEPFVIYCVKFIVWHITLCPLWVALASGGKSGLTRHVHDMALKSPHPIRIGDVEYSRAMVSQLGRVHADPEKVDVVWPHQGSNFSPSLTPSRQQQRQPPQRSDSDTGIIIRKQQQQQRGQELQGSPLPLLAARGGGQSPAISGNSRLIHGDQLMRSPGSQQQPMTTTTNQRIGQALLQKQEQERKQKRKQQHAVEADPQEAPPSWYDFGVAIFLILFGCLAMVAGILSLFISSEDGPEGRRLLERVP